MNRFPIFLAAALTVTTVTGAASQEDDATRQYKDAQQLVQDAMKAKYTAETARIEALQKYELALSALKEVSALYPEWNPELVRRRIGECEKALANLKGAREAVPHPPVAAPAPAAAPRAPAPAPADADFVGHKANKKVHRADCQWAQKMASRNRIYFNTYEEAAAAGYSPCKVCKPDFAAGATRAPPAPPPGSGPATTTNAPYIGHKGTKTVHVSTCPYAKQMALRNRVPFNSFKEAAAAGYKPCKSCNPGTAAGAPGRETAGQKRPPEPEYWASRKGKTFHRPGCEWAKKIPTGSLMKYGTRKEAVDAGKKPCKVCLP